jgi:hypothetical protein
MKRLTLPLVTAFSLLLLAFIGCAEPRGTVSGKVTYKDKALPGGRVVFLSEDGKKVGSAEIQSDGTYTSKDVPIGTCQVAVEPAPKSLKSLMPKGATGPPKDAEGGGADAHKQAEDKYVDIPEHVRRPESSKITVTVERGQPKTFDIPIKDTK